MLAQTAELSAPVTDVVGPDPPVAEILEDAHHRVADDRGAQMAHVHFPGYVRRRVVDHDPLRGTRGWDAQTRVCELAGRLGGDPVVAQREVDEARPADLGLLDHVAAAEVAG